MTTRPDAQWQFWIDRGGTFTDIIARAPDGTLLSRKYLSENPEAYDDAALYGIRAFLDVPHDQPIPAHLISAVKMGTTVATNALLEKKGDDTVLAITSGLADIIEIGYQARPKTFALNIEKPDLLYRDVIEIDERIRADGTIEKPLNLARAEASLRAAFDQGFRSIAIVLMHAYKYPDHEKALADVARRTGFTQISTSHDVSPLTKIVSRGETTIVDAYLTPALQRYTDRITQALQPGEGVGVNDDGTPETGRRTVFFMQSSGGLTDASSFRGRDAILSGPAGGIVGCVHSAKRAGFDKIIGFDMGGTSTDVSHYAGAFEKVYETEVAGVRMRAPMMYIHTVAAGGGSLLSYDGNRFRVGPDSAGANPGPVCYRRGGPLAVTDINVCLGKIDPAFFPQIFGPEQNLPIDRDASKRAFDAIAAALQADDAAMARSPEEVAAGFLDIATEHMAQAIKKISVARGYNVRDYVMNCFGGAGGQHACLVAERLGIGKILLHPFSGVLSAYGMGLAPIESERQKVLDLPLTPNAMGPLTEAIGALTEKTTQDLIAQGLPREAISHKNFVLLRYESTDTVIKVPATTPAAMREAFETIHQRQFGFIGAEKTIIADTLTVEAAGGAHTADDTANRAAPLDKQHRHALTRLYTRGAWHEAPVYKIEDVTATNAIPGPAMIIEPTGTIIIEPGWSGIRNDVGHLILTNEAEATAPARPVTQCDPVTLEIFNNLFMSIAEQMGIVLRNTSQSVNVKERLDFSCAIFDRDGNLVANAPHVPVHLGSMDASVKVIIDGDIAINPGDVFVQNNPYNGGSHLPDITVVTPVFNDAGDDVLFYVAARAHHEDVGGLAPGSMSPRATTIEQEGVILDSLKMVEAGVFMTDRMRAAFLSGQWPARNVDQNIADLKAQSAANAAGARELLRLVDGYGVETVHRYMGFIQDNAEEAVRRVIEKLNDGAFTYDLDDGVRICVALSIDKTTRTARLDFTGTSDQRPNNFNAPGAITRAAILYVFRCLVDDDIPLNAGCMKPLSINIPEGSMLNPAYPAAVVAGNVETSQAVTNALFGALEALGSSQGTMNNLTFGNERYQYYETICSGAPAGPGFDGASGVHTHMTNTRLTDPEILELRYPVLLESFGIDRGSGGLGQWRAGDGVTRRIRFLEPMECSILSGHRTVPPFGLKGGNAGRTGENSILRKDGTREDLDGCAHVSVTVGDMVIIKTPTGGGFGPHSARQRG